MCTMTQLKVECQIYRTALRNPLNALKEWKKYMKNEDIKARSRRNVCILGVPETTSTGRMDTFVESLLTDLFGRESFTYSFVVERAHCTTGPRPIPGAPVRPILARLLNFRDRDTALGMARENGTLSLQGSTIALFPDFTAMVQEARRCTSHALKSGIEVRHDLPCSIAC